LGAPLSWSCLYLISICRWGSTPTPSTCGCHLICYDLRARLVGVGRPHRPKRPCSSAVSKVGASRRSSTPPEAARRPAAGANPLRPGQSSRIHHERGDDWRAIENESRSWPATGLGTCVPARCLRKGDVRLRVPPKTQKKPHQLAKPEYPAEELYLRAKNIFLFCLDRQRHRPAPAASPARILGHGCPTRWRPGEAAHAKKKKNPPACFVRRVRDMGRNPRPVTTMVCPAAEHVPPKPSTKQQTHYRNTAYPVAPAFCCAVVFPTTINDLNSPYPVAALSFSPLNEGAPRAAQAVRPLAPSCPAIPLRLSPSNLPPVLLPPVSAVPLRSTTLGAAACAAVMARPSNHSRWPPAPPRGPLGPAEEPCCSAGPARRNVPGDLRRAPQLTGRAPVVSAQSSTSLCPDDRVAAGLSLYEVPACVRDGLSTAYGPSR